MFDHRDIAFAWPEDDSPGGLEGMHQVMNWGAIRFSVFSDMVIVNLMRLSLPNHILLLFSACCLIRNRTM